MAGWGTGCFAAVKLPRVTPRWRVCDVRLCQTYVQHELASRRPWTEVDSEEPALARPPSRMPHAEVRWGGDPEISPDFLLGFSVSLKLLRETKPVRGRQSATRARRRRSVPRGPPTPRSSRGACGRPPRSPVTHVAASSLGGSARPAPAGPPAPPSTCAARPLTGTGWARGSRVPGRDGTIRGASGHLRPLLPAPCCSHCGTRDQAAARRCLAVTGGYPDAS